jgi:aryl-alcohol dehydrogenase-like predicted oxidoreductase
VTRLGLGLAAIGRPAYINLHRSRDLPGSRSVSAMRTLAHGLLDHAFESGIRYFDAARSYGRAEEFLAGWLDLRGLRGGAVVCGSKWGYTYVGGWRMDALVQEVKDHSLNQLVSQLGESRRLLGDDLRLYQIHSATLESGVLDDREVLARLLALASEGVVVGLSVSGPRQAEVVARAMEVSVDGRNPFTVVQATWNLLQTAAGPALQAAHDRGWGVLVKEGLANGRLLEAGDAGRPLAESAGRHGVGLDALALAAILSQSWCDVVLSGAVSPQQLDSNLKALKVNFEDGELTELAALAEDPAEYWGRRSQLPWR